MWALVESGSVSKVYTRPKSITLGDIQYPSNIFMLWTSSELEAIGIYEVIIDNTNYKDPEYYINTNQSFAFGSVEKLIRLLQPLMVQLQLNL